MRTESKFTHILKKTKVELSNIFILSSLRKNFKNTNQIASSSLNYSESKTEFETQNSKFLVTEIQKIFKNVAKI